MTQFLYDGSALVAEYDAAGAMLRRYFHGDGDDDPQVMFAGASLSAPTYLFSDQQGSVVALADEHGFGTAVNSYDAYGTPAAGNTGRFQYTGQVWMPELGLYYYKARFYSPALNRFLQVDPVGYADQVNLYAYVGNDPVNKTDPNGEQSRYESARQTLDNLRTAATLIKQHPIAAMTIAALAVAIVVTDGVIAPEAAPEIAANVTAIASEGAGATSVSTEASLAQARSARDALATAVIEQGGRPPATVTGGYNTRTGEVAARACGGGRCAEDHVADALGGHRQDIRFTEAVRPRTGREVPVCERCEEAYGRSAFPPRTKFKSDN